MGACETTGRRDPGIVVFHLVLGRTPGGGTCMLLKFGTVLRAVITDKGRSEQPRRGVGREFMSWQLPFRSWVSPCGYCTLPSV